MLQCGLSYPALDSCEFNAGSFYLPVFIQDSVFNVKQKYFLFGNRGGVDVSCHSLQHPTETIMPQIAPIFSLLLFMLRKSLILFCASAISVCLGAQLPILERQVSIHASGTRLTEVFAQMEGQAQFSFSYNSKLIPEEKLVTVDVQNRPVREVLKKMFGESLSYKQRGRFLILAKAPKEEDKKVLVSGYVESAKGEPIPNTTVYDPNTLVSTNTNEYGYFEMKIERKEIPLELSVSKSAFRDTLMPVNPQSSSFQNITLEESPFDSLFRNSLTNIAEGAKSGWYQFVDFVFPSNPETANVSDTLYRTFQCSLFPYVGTNRKMSGRVVNEYSLNIFAGYSMGNEKLEVAGFANINRANVRGAQIAGFSNIVGGNLEGCQIGGFANIVGGDVRGCQIGGFSNTVRGDVEGVQIAGFTNVTNGPVGGVQIAGFSNVNMDTTKSIMIAGFSNHTLGKASGISIAGFSNVHVGSFDGVQLAGFANVNTGKISGTQIAGFANIAQTVHGSQISGFFNYADSISGIPIGFLSFVRKNGYHKFEIAYNEIYPFSIAFRTGVPAFYNILQAGMRFDGPSDTTRWSFGYGVGSAPKLSRTLRLNIDLTANQMTYGNDFDYLNLLNKLDLGFEWQFTKGVALAFGASVNLLIRENQGIYPYLYGDYNPQILETWNRNGYNAQAWIGWKVAIRLF